MFKKITRHTLVASIAVSLTYMICGTAALAEENRHYGERVPSADELIEQLLPKPAYKLRGARRSQQIPANEPSVSLSINFEHDSYHLTETALQQLAPLGEALKSDKLQSFSFKIEGHTDATGADSYNLSLSEKRAIVVGSYLFSKYEVDPSRLSLVGVGESDLYDPENPNSGLNRRVKVSTKSAVIE